MKYLGSFLLTTLLSFIMTTTLLSQQRVIIRTDIQPLPEFGVVVLLDKETSHLMVMDKLVTSGTKEPDADEELVKGDRIIMMNGKRFENLDEFKEQYNAIPAGEEIKIGVRRGEERFIVSATKQEQTKKKTTQIGGNGAQSFSFKGSNLVLAKHGILLKSGDSGIRVDRLIDQLLSDEIREAGISPGWYLTAFNGEEITGNKQLQALYQGLKPGDEITLIFKNEAREARITIEKKTSTTF